jgi:hypothetical protein
MLAFKRACTNMGIVERTLKVDSRAIHHLPQREAWCFMAIINRHTFLLEMPVSDRKQRTDRFLIATRTGGEA